MDRRQLKWVVLSAVISTILVLAGCSTQNANTGIDAATTVPGDGSDFIRNPYSPIVIYRLNQIHLLGGYYEGIWVGLDNMKFSAAYTAYEDISKMDDSNYADLNVFKGNETFHFYNKQAFITKGSASHKPFFSMSHYGQRRFTAPVVLDGNVTGDYMIGINGDWNVFPRKVVVNGNTMVFDPDGKGEKAKLYYQKRKKGNKHVKVYLMMKYKGIVSEVCYLKYPDTPDIGDVVNVLDVNGDNCMEFIINMNDIEFSFTGIYDIYNNMPKCRSGIEDAA